ncbi:MAG: Gfo/Idh/MocA family oxidoreductase [Chitinispirillaceae bacterium]|nr:Gfo/Idh/MocA family oxidoreductase [Chitinispirillaceae bacterium]
MGTSYNWAILGAGHIARKFAADLKLLPNARLYAVGSRSSDRANEFAGEFGIEKACGSYGELAADPKVDIVYIASRHTGHYRDTMLCLEQGKHVLCEKPAAMNGRQLEKMVMLARSKKLFFMEALWTRFLPSFRKVKELVDSGAIGEMRIIEADFCLNVPHNPEHRIWNPDAGGGSLLDIGIYPLFAAMTLGSPVSVITANAKLDDNGIDTFCSMQCAHEKGERSLLYSTITTGGRNELLLHGSNGQLLLNSWWHTPTSIDLLRADCATEHLTFNIPGNGYQYEAAEVMRCLIEGKTESPQWSTGHSKRLMELLDSVRQQTGIRYPEEVEVV